MLQRLHRFALMVGNAIKAVLVYALFLSNTPAQAQDLTDRTTPLKAYFFGNSLLHHLDGLPETSVPYWLNKIAKARGTTLQADGNWGFLLQQAANLPPDPNWQMSGVRSAWVQNRGGLAQSGIDTVVLNPANFLQFQSPNAIIPGDNPERLSPVTATLRVFDWAKTDSGSAPMRFFIYEGWADMDGQVSRFPPTRSELQRYLDGNRTDYHQWYLAYVTALQQARPAMDIQLIPVAATLTNLLTMPELQGLTATDLFTDDAPHGTATLYFLAALISYSTLFQDELPATISLPDSIHPLVRQAYGPIARSLWSQRRQTQRVPKTTTRDEARDQQPPSVPALGIGLNGISDWSTQMPFIDQMKSARPWVGHLTGQWGGMDATALREEGHLSPSGWPLRLPEGIERLETFILADLPPSASNAAGRYRLTYAGKGRISLLGRANEARSRDGEIWFSFTPGDGLVAISLTEIDETDPIRDIRIIHERHLPFWTMGAVFNPDWLKHIENMRVLRFMDWMGTNDSAQEHWQDRPRLGDYTYAWRGAPLEVMLTLANQVGADPWFNMPHRATDDYVKHFASQVAADLSPDLKAYIEYSNEVWNYQFSQAQYAADMAVTRWGRKAREGDAWMQWAGLRAAQIAQLWADAFGATAPQRLTRVISTQTGWPGLENALLNAPFYQAEAPDNQPPANQFDAYAITGYFGFDLGGNPQASEVKNWLRLGQSEAMKRSYKWLRAGDIKNLTQNIFPYHADIAAQHGLDLIMYEGGTHITTHAGWQNDDQLNAFFMEMNYSQEVAALYDEVIDGWQAAGGTLFNAFVDVAAPSKWGSWGGLRHLNDQNPRWAVIEAANARLSTDWEQRVPSAFERGRSLAGTEEAELIEGTTLADMIAAGPGDDWLISNGGSDALHGGPGQDTAILPGQAADYQMRWHSSDGGDFLIVTGPEGALRLRSIEQLEFSDTPGQIYRITPRQ